MEHRSDPTVPAMVQAAYRVSTPVARAIQQSTRRNAFAARVLARARRARLGPAPPMLAALRALETYRRAAVVAATPQLVETARRVAAEAATPQLVETARRVAAE